jgi:hypothetical protein
MSFNRPVLGGISANISASDVKNGAVGAFGGTFGRFTTASDPRTIQINARLSF